MTRAFSHCLAAQVVALLFVVARLADAGDDVSLRAAPTTAADRITSCQSCDDSCGDSNSCGDSCAACCPSWLPEFCGDDCCGPKWIVRGGAVVLTRSRPSNMILFSDAASGAPLFNAKQFGFGWNSGPDIAVLRRLSPGDYLEVRFFDTLNISAAQSLSTPGGFFVNTIPPQAAPVAADINMGYTSTIYSTEVNFRRQISRRISWLAGFRAIQIRDNLDVRALLPAVNVDSHLVATAHNQLYGAQGGFEGNMLASGGPFQIQSVFKAGLFGNAASQTTTDQAVLGGVPVSSFAASGRGGQAAFVGEIGVVSVWQVTQRFWLRCGYELLWIDGLALASNQITSLNLNTFSGLSTAGNVFYHGAIIGGELRF